MIKIHKINWESFRSTIKKKRKRKSHKHKPRPSFYFNILFYFFWIRLLKLGESVNRQRQRRGMRVAWKNVFPQMKTTPRCNLTCLRCCRGPHSTPSLLLSFTAFWLGPTFERHALLRLFLPLPPPHPLPFIMRFAVSQKNTDSGAPPQLPTRHLSRPICLDCQNRE